ncbi:hypothetical protein BP6252_09658 [Coleophoma cylindrospora]|uniref:Phosphoglycerate mutase-like protein n=1 Tax=Coleophoma cylindrospora TaxID=1849047 RepID=A0A3D8QW07_9HELO|nr:hypothetical protein BP6252_09658 [Coleophoma cylindrospora]
MSPSKLFSPLLLTTLPLLAHAVSESQVTWAVVSYSFHGEKEPALASSSYALTPVGGHQAFSAGAAIRDRYIVGNNSDGTETYPINGLSAQAIENSQLYMLATQDEYVANSATAFLQGVYPPVGNSGQGSMVLANNSLESYPLGGYQYASIATVGSMDYNYMWIAGNLECPSYDIQRAGSYSTALYNAEFAASEAFYTSLQSSVFSDFDASIVNYANAYSLYEYALYQSIHNQSAAQALSASDLETLYLYASTQQYSTNSGPNDGSSIQTIAGATIAGKVLEMFGHNIAANGVSDKLTMLFGSFEPMLAFFSLSGLGDSYQNIGKFQTLPLHGSVMTFELFSYTTSSGSDDLSTSFPSIADLHVRFLFRNGSDDSSQLLSYPLFGRGNSELDMSWSDFALGMANFALTDAQTWCDQCGSMTLFCEAIASDTTTTCTTSGASSSSSNEASSMKPWVAGIIGATVTVAVFLLTAVGLAICGGARIAFRRNSAAGGFKGAEKMPEDADVVYASASPDAKAKGGMEESVVRHERVGSWELGSAAKDRGEEGLDKRVVSTADYSRKSEDGWYGMDANPFGDGVKAVDHV